MKKIITSITLLVFISSVYIFPSAHAITLGDIKSENTASDVKADDKGQKINTPLKSEDPAKEKNKGLANQKDGNMGREVNPRLVCLLSVILPGGGHFYMNNDAKGMSFCLAAGAGYTVTGFFMIKTMLADRSTVAYKNYLLLSGFLFFITIVIHFVGIIEAYSDADELNKKNLFDSGAADPYSVNVIIEE